MEPWTEKYRPKNLDEVLGNPSAVANLRDWAEAWNQGPPDKKAVILAGGPGTGKTSAALALAREMGWDVVELNASDVRNAENVEKIVGRAATMQTLGLEGFLSTKQGQRKLILFDEADNLFGTGDRGGAGAIVKVVRSTGQPIILTVNDYYETSRRSPALRSIALKVEFRGVQTGTMSKRLSEICALEGAVVPAPVVKRIAESARGDMRAALNDLQAAAQGGTELTEETATLNDGRDTIGSEFDATRRILFTETAATALQAYETLDTDPERFIVWIDGNLPVLYRGEDLYRGFERLGRADVFLGRTRRRQMYTLWSYASQIMTAGVALAKTEKLQFQPLQFPQWLSQMSRSRESRRIRDGASLKLARHVHASKSEVSETLLPFLKRLLTTDAELAGILEKSLDLEASEMEFLTGRVPEEKEKEDDGSGGDGPKQKRGKGRAKKTSRSEKNPQPVGPEEATMQETSDAKPAGDATNEKPARKTRSKKAKTGADAVETQPKQEAPEETDMKIEPVVETSPEKEGNSAPPKGKALKQLDLSNFGERK